MNRRTKEVIHDAIARQLSGIFPAIDLEVITEVVDAQSGDAAAAAEILEEMSLPTPPTAPTERSLQQSAPARIALRESHRHAGGSDAGQLGTTDELPGESRELMPVYRPPSKRRVFPRSAPQRQLDPSRSKLTGGDGSDGSGEAIQRMLDGLAPRPKVMPAWSSGADHQAATAQTQAAQAQAGRCERLSDALAAEPELEPEPEPPSPEQLEELEEYARYYGIDPRTEPSLMWIAREGMEAPLPDGWNEELDGRGVPYYYETATRRTQWKHPYDDYFKDLVRRAREALRRRAPVRHSESNMQTLDDAAGPAAGGAPSTSSAAAAAAAPATSAADDQLEQFFAPSPSLGGSPSQSMSTCPSAAQNCEAGGHQQAPAHPQQPIGAPEARSIVF